MEAESNYIKGRGAQVNTHNPFFANRSVKEHWEGIDEEEEINPNTKFLTVFPKTIINEVNSPDLGLEYSMNPYQGCEHGCTYCYARNSHQYWGYSAGTDFEKTVLVKENAPQILEQTLRKPNWEVKVLMFSGNTDCYQPIEKKYEITRKCLQVLLKYRHPVGMITKNALIQRDIDILSEMNQHGTVHVAISLNSLNEDLRRVLEPRTATSKRRLETIEKLSAAGIPVTVMIAPIIPALNNHEIFNVAKAASEAGARGIGHTVVRLNGSIGEVFRDWVRKNFPDRAQKVLHQIESCHGGNINDSQWGRRMRGDGNIAQEISDMMRIARQKYFKGREIPPLNFDAFIRTPKNGQMAMF